MLAVAFIFFGVFLFPVVSSAWIVLESFEGMSNCDTSKRLGSNFYPKEKAFKSEVTGKFEWLTTSGSDLTHYTNCFLNNSCVNDLVKDFDCYDCANQTDLTLDFCVETTLPVNSTGKNHTYWYTEKTDLTDYGDTSGVWYYFYVGEGSTDCDPDAFQFAQFVTTMECAANKREYCDGDVAYRQYYSNMCQLTSGEPNIIEDRCNYPNRICCGGDSCTNDLSSSGSIVAFSFFLILSVLMFLY